MILILLSALAPGAWAQSLLLQLLSEMRRVDPKGEIRLSDSGGSPREILSPGLIRNGYHSVRIVIRPQKGKPYTLDIAQNPENSAVLKLYREVGDTLLPVKFPLAAIGAAPESFWLDMQVPAPALVRRVRIEAQLHDDDTWHVAPMEVRVLRGILPTLKTAPVVLPPASSPSDVFARQAWREWLCAETPKPLAPSPGRVLTQGQLIYRNAMQDVAAAKVLQLQVGREELLAQVLPKLGAKDVEGFCKGPRPVMEAGPDAYLGVRDFVNRQASR